MAQFDDEVRVEYTLDATVNLTNFENVKPGYRVASNVRPGEHPNETRARLKKLVVGWLEEDIDEARKG